MHSGATRVSHDRPTGPAFDSPCVPLVQLVVPLPARELDMPRVHNNNHIAIVRMRSKSWLVLALHRTPEAVLALRQQKSANDGTFGSGWSAAAAVNCAMYQKMTSGAGIGDGHLQDHRQLCSKATDQLTLGVH